MIITVSLAILAFFFVVPPRIVHTELSSPVLAIKCYIEGTPPFLATWTRDNVALSSSDYDIITSFENDTWITRISLTNTTGQSGLFSCVVENGVGSANATFQVELQSRFTLMILKCAEWYLT